jgi:hypothetical protein
LVAKNKAIIVEENAPEFANRLRQGLEKILTPEIYTEMKRASGGQVRLDAAHQIAKGIVGLIK